MTIKNKFEKFQIYVRLFQLIFFFIFYLTSMDYTNAYKYTGETATTKKNLYTTAVRKISVAMKNSFNNTTTTTTMKTTTTFTNSSKRPDHEYIEEIKNNIKRVLNLELKNDTIDEYVVQTFNVYNPDPLYVFVLPDGTNKTLAFRRSFFAAAIFPNVSTLQTLQKIAKEIIFIKNGNLEEKSTKLWSNDEIFRKKYEQFKVNANDLNEAESIKIVEENVRTERNFFKFMDTIVKNEPVVNNDESEALRLNDYQSFSKEIHATDLLGNYKSSNNRYETAIPKNPPKIVSWKDLGLDGWAGSIETFHGHPEENRKKKPVTLINSAIKTPLVLGNKFIPISPDFDPLLFLTTTAPTQNYGSVKKHETKRPSAIGVFPEKDKKHSTSIHQYSFITHSKPSTLEKTATFHPVQLFRPAPTDLRNDTWEVNYQVPSEYGENLKQEKIKAKNLSHAFTLSMNLTKWPMTSSRSLHRDSDVFIARANNPFGHSTKWKWSNSTQNDVSIDEGRYKRGVLELYSMVKCATGCDPLIYKGYGCYCGFLGRGRALDGIDRCCKMHDYCYEVANCPKFLEYFVPYLWKCYKGRPLCATDHGEWGGPGSCASMLCECDKALSKCLRHFYCPRKRSACTSSPLRLLQNVIMDL